MGKRRFALVATSDDEDDLPPRATPKTEEEQQNHRKKKKKKVDLVLDDEEEEERERVSKQKEKEDKASASGEEEEEAQEDAKPIGEAVRVSGKGRGRRNHYEAFEYDGLRYDLEDPVLLVPEEPNQKPYVAIIKDITQKTNDQTMMVTGQWFYRPEEAEKKGGGNWQSSDTRELFYSFHRDEIPAESVMHKCVVHFIPLNKQIPNRKLHPGFIVQKVYDTEQRRLFKLTDKDYEDNKQEEIDVLVKKTFSRLGDLPDIETEDTPAEEEDQSKSKRMLKKKDMPRLDVSRDDETTTRFGQSLKVETPGSVTSNTSEYCAILSKFEALTGETQRDKWLDRHLQGIQFVFSRAENGQSDNKDKGGLKEHDSSSKGANGSQEKSASGKSFVWPDAAVTAVTALEKACHEALSSDFQKYNQKMRQLLFNLKNNALLARRLLKGELEPSKILNMSPNELKEGLTAEEIASKQPEESQRMQMTDARCRRCMEKKVGLTDIIQTGHGDRYQLECTACGNTWYASRDEASALTIEAPSSAKSVGTAPLATTKFENVEKKLVSPRESDKSADDVFKKTTEAYMPVLETQKSFKKPRTGDNSSIKKDA